MMLRIFQRAYAIINVLSVDIALGAVIGALFFASRLHVAIKLNGLIALGFTVWAIYTTDHLLDAYKVKGEASTYRHRFHQRYFKVLTAGVILASLVILVQLFYIRKPVLLGGVMLGWLVATYIIAQHKLKNYKEIAGAILYTMGITVAPFSLSSSLPPWPEFLILGQYFLTALINLLIFALIDIPSDARDERISFATYFGERKTTNLIVLLIVANLCVSIVATAIGLRDNLNAEICIVGMNIVLGAIVLWQGYFRIGDRYRRWGDAIFYLPLICILHP